MVGQSDKKRWYENEDKIGTASDFYTLCAVCQSGGQGVYGDGSEEDEQRKKSGGHGKVPRCQLLYFICFCGKCY